jgi:hypothetical protein
MSIDISVLDEIGWRLPPDLLAENVIECDESVHSVSYELIQVEALVQICKDVDNKEIPAPDFFVHLTESISEYILANDLENDTIDDYYLTVYEWAESINDEITSDAEQQLEDRLSGDYWRD